MGHRNKDAAVRYIQEGDTHLSAGDFHSAEQQYRLALEADSNSAEALQSLGFLRLQQMDYHVAAQCGQRAIEADPDFKPGYNLLGNALLGLRRYEEALAVLPKGPTDSRRMKEILHLHMGLCCAGLGRRPEAERHVREALEADPTYQTRFLPVGVITHDPFHADAHLVLARILGQRGNHVEAELHDRLARRMDPKVALSPVAEAIMGDICDILGPTDQDQ